MKYAPLAVCVLVACSDPATQTLPREELMDPETCRDCHPDHYREWAGSMHAYASDDPFFRAMNELGQEETDGALAGLCVGCHAPVAVMEGLTEDGLNLDEVPQAMKGITCYYCHTVTDVEDTHNNQLVVALDTTMRGSVADPVATDAHESSYSRLHDGKAMESADLCGSCHDVVLPNGIALERVYAEWSDSLYGDHIEGAPGAPEYYSQRCNSCHMPGSNGPIADSEGAQADRRRHDHTMPGPGVVVSDFPPGDDGEDLRLENLEAMESFRRSALCASLCVMEDGGEITITVWLHNETAGHGWPSGAAQDRRAWVEVQAMVGDTVAYESGVLGPQDAVGLSADPDLWWFGDRIFNADGDPVHAHWEVESYEGGALPVPESLGGDPDTWQSRTYQFTGEMPDEVSLRMNLRPMPVDLLDELVGSGHLEAAIRDALPTFDVAPIHLDWTAADAEPSEVAGSCVSSAASCKSPWI
jgi:hypothetical protein